MIRTPFYWFLIYVHTAFGLLALVTSVASLRADRGSARHRRIGWWFTQALAGLMVTTALMAALRYTLFLFVIGYAAWYASHRAWLVMARADDRPYLAGPLARRVQDDLAIVFGLSLMAAVVGRLVWRDWPVTPWGLGLGVAFVWGGVLAALGWAARTGRLLDLPKRTRHVVCVAMAVVATWSEFFADVTVHLVSATMVWVLAWILPAVSGAYAVHRAVDLRACLATLVGRRPPSPRRPQTLRPSIGGHDA